MHENTIDALRAGNHAQALLSAREAVASNPDSAEAQHLLAMALVANGDREGALAAIDTAIVRAPDRADFHLQRASYLIGGRDIEQARQELAKAVALDPNQLAAYVLQAQLAIGLGDIETAEKNVTLARRVAEEHPWVLAVSGMVRLLRDDRKAALVDSARALELAPNDPQVLQAAVHAYIANDHLAFAEQAVRKLQQAGHGGDALQILLIQLLERQGRVDEAADGALELVAAQADPSARLLRQTGMLALRARRDGPARDVLLRTLRLEPEDRLTLDMLFEAWRRLDAMDEARQTLSQLTQSNPDTDTLWLGRLVPEPLGGEAAKDVIEEWVAARPSHVPALEALMLWHVLANDSVGADAVAGQVVALQPGRPLAEQRVVEALMANDPDAAMARVRAMIASTDVPVARFAFASWLGQLQDRADRLPEALETWVAAQAEREAAASIPLPTVTDAPADGWRTPHSDGGQVRQMVLYGPPGAGTDFCARLLSGVPGFRPDRFGPTPPGDMLQQPTLAQAVANGDIAAGQVARDWRDGFAARGREDGSLFDWLPFWDNALLPVFSGEQGEVPLLFVVRDPRDMLLEWLAFGAQMALPVADVDAAAHWLAAHVAQLAELDALAAARPTEVACRVLRIDDVVYDEQKLAERLGRVIGQAPPTPVQAPSARFRFPFGYWRRYRHLLAEPFARLTPVAVRLGYPEA